MADFRAMGRLTSLMGEQHPVASESLIHLIQPSRAMQFLRLTKQQFIILSILLLTYSGGYSWARAQQILIHRITFVTEDGERRYSHSISTGDFGPGLLQGPITPWVISGSYWVFTPLRWLESSIWFLLPNHDNAA